MNCSIGDWVNRSRSRPGIALDGTTGAAAAQMPIIKTEPTTQCSAAVILLSPNQKPMAGTNLEPARIIDLIYIPPGEDGRKGKGSGLAPGLPVIDINQCRRPSTAPF
jgi:hypothetical protein